MYAQNPYFPPTDSWQTVINSSLNKNSATIRDAAVAALSELCKSYYDDPSRQIRNSELLDAYLTASKEHLWEFERIGYVLAIGALPQFIIEPRLEDVLLTLIAHSLTQASHQTLFKRSASSSQNVTNWSEARRDSVKALSNVIQTIGFERIAELTVLNGDNCLDKIFESYLLALQEYTIDNRGDIGAWVREAAMNALYKLIVTVPHQHLNEQKVHAIVGGLLQQAVEKIDRTRALAGKLFCKIIYQ